MQCISDYGIQSRTFPIHREFSQGEKFRFSDTHKMEPYDTCVLTRALVSAIFDNTDDSLAQFGRFVRAKNEANYSIPDLGDATRIIANGRVEHDLLLQNKRLLGVQKFLPVWPWRELK